MRRLDYARALPRDRRTILAMVVLPLLIYPLLIIVISQLGLQQVEKLRQSRARVVAASHPWRTPAEAAGFRTACTNRFSGVSSG